MLRLSNFSIPIHRNDDYLIFVTKTCNFYKFDGDDYDYLINFNKRSEEIDTEEMENIQPLIDIGVLSTKEDDSRYVEDMQIAHNVVRYSPSDMGLTIVPTVSCNLRCPYCFEETKPKGIMKTDVADNLIKFIEDHVDTRRLSLTWFGGEPLLGFKVMEYLLPKLHSLKEKKITGHSMVTNGTLLTEEKFDLFKKYPLDSIQITLDGAKPTHDTKRFFPGGKGTYELILGNLDKFTEEFPKTRISIRINVDNHNADQYQNVAAEIIQRFKGKNVSAYPGILVANRGCESEQFFSSDDHAEFQKKLWNEGYNGYGYPSLCSKGCSATTLNSYIIGPRGELYKCWEHVGNGNKVVGDIFTTDYRNHNLFNDFILRGLCFNDPKCRECGLLPVCSGGCPKKRIDNHREGLNHDLCSIYNRKGGRVIEDILYEYFCRSQA
ncbi:MAG: radical SAM protein [Muribaculum sp.]|nr:radical SAM protein [Muribaculum sp.]